ncbi:uncharacterized protein IWZ02DRAFT_271255 [Phyllosticta citriasiana]|uniref:Secreted protein n=1 Tax=Phyllosticta citriasiana TaxID=595635 RepID=A0ABR1KZH9_9PEZI
MALPFVGLAPPRLSFFCATVLQATIIALLASFSSPSPQACDHWRLCSAVKSLVRTFINRVFWCLFIPSFPFRLWLLLMAFCLRRGTYATCTIQSGTKSRQVSALSQKLCHEHACRYRLIVRSKLSFPPWLNWNRIGYAGQQQ